MSTHKARFRNRQTLHCLSRIHMSSHTQQTHSSHEALRGHLFTPPPDHREAAPDGMGAYSPPDAQTRVQPSQSLNQTLTQQTGQLQGS